MGGAPAKKPKKKGGRRKGDTKVRMDKATLKRVEELGATGISQLVAAKCLGVSDDTFTEYLKEYPEFSAAWRSGKAMIYDTVAQAARELVPKLLAEALAGDGRSRDTLLRLLDESFHPPQTDVSQQPAVGAPTVQFILPDNGRPRHVEAQTIDVTPRLPAAGTTPEKKAG